MGKMATYSQTLHPGKRLGWSEMCQNESLVQDNVVPDNDPESLVVVRIRQPCLYVAGKHGMEKCQMRIDTGAGRTVVDTTLVEPCNYIGKNVTLTSLMAVPC